MPEERFRLQQILALLVPFFASAVLCVADMCNLSRMRVCVCVFVFLQMTTHNVGALLVMNKEREGEIAGIITERDYLRKIIVQGRSSKSTKVGDIMTEENKLITVSPETKVLKAMQLMTGRGMTVCIYRECYTREACHTLLAL
eukprot:TRINITY_DN250_c0_g1_i4.p1 TRINITY_DN250_c0_g1~~TRINITY_DN250_c0_g1_i4.p1  ORF type:complete len:143 (-),score=13.52 TRINITY_DN250_c0_g1_i4:724-1152(-)